MSILIVDDSSMFRKAIKEELSESSFKIIEAKDHQECMDKLSDETELVILDIEMPEKNGFEVYSMIRKFEDKNYAHKKSLPIIFLSSSDSYENRMKGYELGALDFVSKSFEEGELLLYVEKILHPKKRFADFTVLAVEDSQFFLKVVTHLLAQMGLNILTAADGQEALEIYKDNRDDIHIIVTDHNMPNMTGIELTKAIRNTLGDKDIPIVILSANDEKKLVPELFRAGASDYINKPYIKEEFVARLESHIESYNIKMILRKDIKKQKQFNKLKDEFLTICSHDLRSPLCSILGYAEVLQEDDHEITSNEKKDFLHRISKAGNFLLTLINSLLDLQKMGLEQEYIWKPTHVRSLLRSSLEQMKGQADHKHIEIIYTDELMEDSVVLLDSTALNRVFNNLLSNAIKFTPKGKKVFISITHEDEDNVRIQFQDEGIGIEESRIDSIFQKFTKESKSGTDGEKGTGLGLSIVQEIIANHDGKVWVESPGVEMGSTFVITLPVNH